MHIPTYFKTFFKNGSRILCEAVQAAFGQFTWTRPGWIKSLSGFLGRTLFRQKKNSALVAMLLLAVIGSGYQISGWWLARPKPVEINFSIENPARTEIENDKPPNPLTVKFDESVAPLALIGKEVTKGIRISPAIAGVWHWEDDKSLVFIPKDDWPIGAEYKVSFEKSTFAPQIHLGEYSFKFQTPPFVIKITDAQFYQDPVNPALKKGVVELNFSHPVTPQELEKRIQLQLSGLSAGKLGLGRETAKYTVSYDKFKLNAYIHSEALPIPKEDSEMLVSIEKGVKAARGGIPYGVSLSRSIRIPGLYSLEINSINPIVVTNERYETDQVLVIETSASIHEKEMRRAASAWVLPLYHPKSKPKDRTEPYNWGDISEITQDVLKQGLRLQLEAIPGEREYTETHSFKYRADVGRYVYMQIDKGVNSFGGYLLPRSRQEIFRVPPFPPELSILSKGALLPLSGDKRVAVMVRDLPGIKMEIGRVLPSQLQHLVSQSGGDFSNPEFSGTFGGDNLIERFVRHVPLPNLKHGRAHYEAIDLAKYLKNGGNERRGIFLLTVQGYDPESKEKKTLIVRQRDPSDDDGEGDHENDESGEDSLNPEHFMDKRLVLVTDLGILAKKSLDGSQDVFVQSIHNGSPVAAATVEVIGKNGLTLFSHKTDATGRAHFPKLDGLSRERAPLLYMVTKDRDMSFLPLNRRDRNLDMTRFDVGGVSNALLPDQLDAYLFSDRGIYRPGDTLHIGLIVKATDWNKTVKGLPLEAEVLDPRGLVVRREKVTLPGGGFTELTHTTQETSPTGAYTINLFIVKDGKAGEQIGSTTVKVQEFLPDRMKMSVRLSGEAAEGWVNPKDLKARVSVQNLFGTPAENRQVEATLSLSPSFPAFKSYADYQFYDPQRAKESFSTKLQNRITNERGEAEFNLGLERYSQATYRLHLLTRAFELEGGRSVTAETSTLVSELPFLIGYKADGLLNYISRGSKRTVSLIAIDPRAKKMMVGKLNLRLMERTFVSVLTKEGNGTYKYESRKREVSLKERALAIPAAGLNLPLDTDKPGDFACLILDEHGVELNRVEYSVAGKGNVTRSLERNAELQMVLNKNDYMPGENIEISIRAPYTGAGLITIERDKVYAHKWFKTNSSSSVQKIRLPKGFEGNGYVSVQFIRDPASDEIFMSPLSYGAVPFMTSLTERTNKLALTVPKLVKPGQQLRMKLAADQPTRGVVFVVDEGILQVARYQTPAPLAHFFKKRTLDVKTSQILDLILPEFRKLMAAAAPGGDAEGLLGRHLNPFKRKRDKPVVFWSGIVEIGKNREFVYNVPEYFNGTLHVMAVTVNNGRIGVAQTQSLVRGDFVLSPNVPLSVTPGDEFEVTVAVANNVKGSGRESQVSVALNASQHLEVVGSSSQKVKIGEMREKALFFRLRAKEQLGSATLTFSAAASGKSGKLSTDVSVRPATPHYTLVSAGSFKGAVEVPVQRDLYSNYRSLEAGVSVLPLVLAGGLSNYLDNYTHQCTEQLVSQVIPKLVLGKRPEFRKNTTGPKKSFDTVINELRTRQNAEGGFGLWTASVQADEFASVYMMHLLQEAGERGERIPADMLQKGSNYLQQLAASPVNSLSEARVRAYAAYILTRQGVVTTPLLTGLRETLEAKYAGQWQQDSTAVFLAATYKLLKQERIADSLIAKPIKRLGKHEGGFRFEYYHDPLIEDAETLYIVAKHFPQQAHALSAATLTTMMKPIQEGRFNSLSAAYTILALDAYATTVGTAAAGKLKISEIGRDGKSRILPLPNHLFPLVPFTPGSAKLMFSSDAKDKAFYFISETGYDRKLPTKELRNGVEISREYLTQGGEPVKKLKIGDEITVRLRIRSTDRRIIPNLAIIDLLPGGFEPALEKILNAEENNGAPNEANRLGGHGSWRAEYVDVREDRVVLYGSANHEMKEFTYRIKATNAGTFVLPPAYVESLYERTVQARSLPGRITVTRPNK